jgi:hypothetical protein
VLRDAAKIQGTSLRLDSRLCGTTSEKLLEEVKQNAASWNYLDYAPALKDGPVLKVEADDRNLSDNQAVAGALRKLGNSRVTETHMATDHIFSDHRCASGGGRGMAAGTGAESITRLDLRRRRRHSRPTRAARTVGPYRYLKDRLFDSQRKAPRRAVFSRNTGESCHLSAKG